MKKRAIDKLRRSDVLDRAMELLESQEYDYPGICLECGCDQGGCEPDMRRGECEHCGAKQVYGCGELILMLG